MATSLWHRSGDTQLRKTVFEPANGAVAQFFVGGTSTPLVVFNDAGESSPAGSEVAADAQGRWPFLYVPTGNPFDYYIRDTDGTLITSGEDVPNPTVNASVTPDVGAYETGDILFGLKAGTRAGWVRLNGRTIGSAASAATERANDDTGDLFEYIWNALSDTAAPVSGGRGASASADFAANKTLSMPDARGSALRGLDDMGSTDAARLSDTPFSLGTSLTAGSVAGANAAAITAAQLPVHRHGSGTLSIDPIPDHTHGVGTLSTASAGGHNHGGATASAGDHQHDYNTATGTQNAGSDGAPVGGFLINQVSQSTSTAGAHTHTISTDGEHTHAINGATAAGGGYSVTIENETADAGSGATLNVVARDLLGTWYIKL